jgi:hypothetical protein
MKTTKASNTFQGDRKKGYSQLPNRLMTSSMPKMVVNRASNTKRVVDRDEPSSGRISDSMMAKP